MSLECNGGRCGINAAWDLLVFGARSILHPITEDQRCTGAILVEGRDTLASQANHAKEVPIIPSQILEEDRLGENSLDEKNIVKPVDFESEFQIVGESSPGLEVTLKEVAPPAAITPLRDRDQATNKRRAGLPLRPKTHSAWTACFALVCVCFLPGALYNHLAVTDLTPALKALPSNLATGFDEVFKFAYLKQDASDVQSNAALALSKCNVVADVACLGASQIPVTLDVVNTDDEKNNIVAEFQHSLGIIYEITSDPYFGTAGLANTDKQLKNILVNLQKISIALPCSAVVQIYCPIYSSAKLIVAGIGEVDKAIAEFKNAEIVSTWENYADILNFLHLWPYVLMIGALFFGYFWYKHGECCCCYGRSKLCCCLVPYIFFWIVAFGLYAAVVAIGILAQYAAGHIKIDALRGEPNIEEVADHIRNRYPEFWDVALRDPLAALDNFWLANIVMLIATLLLGIYSVCDCACCPYQKLIYASEYERKF